MDISQPEAELKKLLDSGHITQPQFDVMLAALRATAASATVGSGAAALGDGAVAVAPGGVNVAGDFKGILNSGTQLTFNIPYDGPSPKDQADKQFIYLNVLARLVSDLPLGAMDPKDAHAKGNRERVQLADVFIRLDTTQQIDVEKAAPDAPNTPAAPVTLVGRIKRVVRGLLRGGRAEPAPDRADFLPSREETRPLRLFEAVAKNRHVVVTGEPGSGKSTAVNYLIWCSAVASADPNRELPEIFSNDWPAGERALTPIRVILRDFEVWLRKQADDAAGSALITNFIDQTLAQQNLDFAGAWLRERLEAGRAFVVLDGLDEIATLQGRIRARDAIAAFARRYASNRILVTCRTLSYQEPTGDEEDLRLPQDAFPQVAIAALDDDKIEAFVEAWHTELQRVGRITDSDWKTRLQERLLTALRRPDLRELAGNPLQLTLMAWVHTDSDELPDKRAKLYSKALELLLWRWEVQKQRSTLTELAAEIPNGQAEIVRQLQRVAYTAHAAIKTDDKNALADVDEADLRRGLAQLKKDPITRLGDENWARDVVDAIRTRSGLLARRDENKLTFPHRTFQEFLAGLHMLEKGFVEQALAKTANLNLWREPILMASGYTVYVQDNRDLEKPNALALRLCTTPCEDEDLRWKRVWLAGQVLCEVKAEDVKEKYPGTFVQVQELLLQLVREGHLTPTERGRAGGTLSQIGDPRFSEAQHFLPVRGEALLGFVEIPAGEVYMGTAKADFEESKAKERLREQLAVSFYENEVWPNANPVFVPRFFAARYQTTVAQFRAFVAATGFVPGDRDALADDDNSPVRWVSWDEALAYCNWLNDALRDDPATPEPLRRVLADGSHRVALLSEAEWERACRADDPTRPIFPWGNDVPDVDADDFANIIYARINSTCAVGLFPKGRGPFELHDMVGNLWEWTRSENKPYPYDAADGREDVTAEAGERVVRGGAFDYNQYFARCAVRFRYPPGYRYVSIGFRVCVSPLSH